MKSKFLGIIVTLAVVLGLVLVPAMVPAMVSATPVEKSCWLEIEPSTQKVAFNSPFEVNVTFHNPVPVNLSGISCHINFTASLVYVDSIDYGFDPFSFNPLAVPDWNNTEGWLDWDGSTPMEVESTNATSGLFITIHMMTRDTKGVADLEFDPTVVAGTPECAMSDPTAEFDYLNWSLIVEGNVTVGSPELTVNVTGEGNVRIDGDVPPGYPNTTQWGWYPTQGDVPLKAEPALGWRFDSWSEDLSGNVTPTTIRMDALTKNVTANFVEKPCKLDVSPDNITCAASQGPNQVIATPKVTVTNTGGGTLHWAVGYPPIWSYGDTWSWVNTYIPMALFNPLLPGGTTNELIMVVTDDTDPHDYTVAVVLGPYPPDNVPGAQRTIVGGAPAVLWNATAWIDKCTLDYTKQEGYLTVWGLGPDPVNVYATVSWVYDGCHGWPYYVGKTWSYNMSQVVSLTPGGAAVLPPDLVPVTAEVVGIDSVVTPAGTFDCYHIVHNSTYPPFNGGTMIETWWSDEERNFVLTEDIGTFDPPSPPGPIPGAVDIRALVDMSITGLPAPACCDAPVCNLSFDKMSCNLGAGETAAVTVTCDVTGLDEGTHNSSFCITGCCCHGLTYECVNVTCTVLPPTTIDVCRTIPLTGDSNKPGETIETYPGETFNVTVTFKSPIDDFNAISLTDLAPAGWEVYTERGWSKADDGGDVVDASEVRVAGNKVEIAWDGPFNATTSFTALYQVTVPETAIPGVNTWPDCDMDKAWAEYWFGPQGPHTSYVMGKKGDCDSELIATVPGDIVGETRDVNANPLPNVDVALYRVGDKFTTSGDGVAEWSTEKVKFGSYSAKLTVPAGFTPSDEARVVIAYSGKVSSIESIGYWWIEESGNPNPTPDYPQVPYLIIELDTTGNGAADTWLAPHRDPAPLTIPTPWTEQITTHDGGTLAHPGFIAGNISDYDDDDVLAIKVMVGCWGAPNTVAGIGYVDDITINGVTYELESSEVALRSDESTPDYSDTAYITGEYWLWATKDRYSPLLTKPEAVGGTMLSVRNPPHPYYLDFSTPKLLSEGYSLNFSGDYGLIPTAPTMSYAMESINHYLFTPIEWIDEEDFVPRPEWKLSVTKAGDVIAAWQVPS